MNLVIVDLKNLLGVESKDSWIKFMDRVEHELPFLSGSGAPKKADIEASIIGREGCKSWAEFIEKRLNWNYHSWKAWRKAYLMVKKFPYLRDLGLTASEINTIKQKTDVFPEDIESFNSLKAQKKAESEQNHKESLRAANLELARSRSEADSLRLKVSELEKDLDASKNRKMILPAQEKPSRIPLITSIALNAILIITITLILKT